MKKSILKLGKELNKASQKSINGGSSNTWCDYSEFRSNTFCCPGVGYRWMSLDLTGAPGGTSIEDACGVTKEEGSVGVPGNSPMPG
ncbi:hypothetical protein ABW636_04415 [Aquimarina sp. 2201CG1-2-11]|uniref:hypothetical protein n=1 Tax=Aquimarina discodermiae TaxID=3231043 RepID=UPI003462575B